MAKKVTIDIRDEIMSFINKEDRKLPWLAKQTGISYSHLYFVLKKKERKLTQENKDRINYTLKTSF